MLDKEWTSCTLPASFAGYFDHASEELPEAEYTSFRQLCEQRLTLLITTLEEQYDESRSTTTAFPQEATVGWLASLIPLASPPGPVVYPWHTPSLQSLAQRALCLLAIASNPVDIRPETTVTPPTQTPVLCDSTSQDTVSRTLAKHFADNLVRHHVIPYFTQATPRWETSRPHAGKPKQRTQEERRIQFHLDQPWKKKHPGTVLILAWCAKHYPVPWTQGQMMQFVPATLTLLDDYDCYYKWWGVAIGRDLLANDQQGYTAHLKSSGLTLAFYNALTQCLIYRADEALARELLVMVYQELPQWISYMHTPRSEKWYQSMEQVVYDGILKNFLYHGERVGLLPLLFEHVAVYARALGLSTVAYLKPLLAECCKRLQDIIMGSPDLLLVHLGAAQAMRVLIQTCRPRIAYYDEMITHAFEASWAQLSDPINATLSELPQLRALLLSIVDELQKGHPVEISESTTVTTQDGFRPLG
ncbi:hypothetical protein IWQ62_001049 [Dispira parvispora]|uniref:Uncharacterized protein n=1 Tax=Dispira parvispora TaxID=1520584 RepID=A0A9W8E4B6_9FUNG|nr:hypothetical protein IWQ62_001049 [Dispira parvispora]